MTDKKLTNRQAIGVLDGLWSNPLFGETHRQAFEIGIKAIKALEQEPKIVPIAEIKFDDDMLREIVEEAVKNIEIEPKTGHWEWVQYDYNPKFGNWHCSECRCVVVECVGKEEKGGIPLYKYCPQCGAKMVKPQERSE